MRKLGGKLNYNIAVLISGRGSNLKSIFRNSLEKKSCYKVMLVISNKKNAKGLLFAKKKKYQNLYYKFY